MLLVYPDNKNKTRTVQTLKAITKLHTYNRNQNDIFHIDIAFVIPHMMLVHSRKKRISRRIDFTDKEIFCIERSEAVDRSQEYDERMTIAVCNLC